MREFRNILVTGGAGFVGSNFIRYILSLPDFKGRVVNLDAMTTAWSGENLREIEGKYGAERYCHIRGNICNRALVSTVFSAHNIDAVVNFAAETPAASRDDMPGILLKTNINGTQVLLQAAEKVWKSRSGVLFHHVSTGDASMLTGYSAENKDAERSSYSAYLYYKSKASSNNAVLEYNRGYGVPATISNCAANFGPYQHPDRSVAAMILGMKEGRTVAVPRGEGMGRMIYVDDHSSAIWAILKNGRQGDIYNIGSENSCNNSCFADILCGSMSAYTGRPGEQYKKLITFPDEKPCEDINRVVCCGKLKNELGWIEACGLEKGLGLTVKWYHENSGWVSRVKS